MLYAIIAEILIKIVFFPLSPKPSKCVRCNLLASSRRKLSVPFIISTKTITQAFFSLTCVQHFNNGKIWSVQDFFLILRFPEFSVFNEFFCSQETHLQF
jgi:hypothetical protein